MLSENTETELHETLEEKFRGLLNLIPDCDRQSFYLGAESALRALGENINQSPNWKRVLFGRFLDLDAEFREFLQHEFGGGASWSDDFAEEGHE